MKRKTIKEKSLKLNFIMNAILTMSSFIFPLITFPYVSRILLPVGTGKVSFATSVVSYFALIAQLGIPTYGIRACAKIRDDKEKLTKTVQEIFIINIVMSIFAYVLFFIALFSVPRLREDTGLFLIISTTIIFNAIGVEWLYKALEEYSYITFRSIIFKFIALILTFLFVKDQNDYVIYGGITIFAAVGSNIFNFINLHKYIRFKPLGNYNLKKHLKAISVFFAMSCATTIYTHMDTVMLGFLKSDIDVGYYNAAVKIKGILVSVVTALGTVLLPRVSYYVEKGMKNEFDHVTRKALNFILVIAVPLAVYFILFAKEGIFFLSGKEYGGAILPMQIIMPTIIFIGLTNIMGIQMLVPIGRELTVLYSELAGAIANLIINAILIPRMASAGAAIGTLVAEIIVWAVQFYALREIVVNIYKKINYLRILVALVLSSIVSIGIKNLDCSYFMTIMISGIIFFGMYFILLIIMKEPLVREIISNIMQKIIRISSK